MTVFEPTEQARAAAARATVLAGIARRRALFTSAWNGRALLVLADLLDTVALSFYEEAPAADGIPTDADLALCAAEVVAMQTPGTGFPVQLGQYVTHAVTGRPLTVPAPVGPDGGERTTDDTRLVSALETLHGHLAAAPTEDVAQALLEAVLAVHDKRADLAQLARG
ncbi:hypothetical protein OG840_61895 [Streptomyces sp. NBC_01764]|uniref:hypothetical protein n=1 Tax=Streptomyces sp. NBC_01764 TaxID=2975935 RepID=UPI00224FDDB1|nr:hypothetical protein [Streptomyces sp. NBC_01764]MCX4411646.1 hypothetical protein [Streptomyces sp. NBC_01764]